MSVWQPRSPSEQEKHTAYKLNFEEHNKELFIEKKILLALMMVLPRKHTLPRLVEFAIEVWFYI